MAIRAILRRCLRLTLAHWISGATIRSMLSALVLACTLAGCIRLRDNTVYYHSDKRDRHPRADRDDRRRENPGEDAGSPRRDTGPAEKGSS